MTTLLDLREDVRSRLNEVSARFWQDAELDRWINQALTEVARRSETLQDRAEITTAADVQEFSMPVDTIRVYRVEWMPDAGTPIYPLEYRDFSSMDQIWYTSQNVTTGIPSLFSMWGYPPQLKVVLYPKPSQDGRIRVFYYRLPATIVSDIDTAEIPAGWESLIALHCEYVALRKDADQRWQEAKSLFEEGLNSMLTLTRRWTDQSDSIQAANGNWLPRHIYDWDY